MIGETTGAVRVLLRLEGFCVLVAACVAYSKFGLGWSTFAIYFLVPDISLLGYFAGAKVGAISYNTAHSYLGCQSSDRLYGSVSDDSMGRFNLVCPHRF